MGHSGRPAEPRPSGSNTGQVSLVVQVSRKAKAQSEECHKIQALRARLEQKYGDTFFKPEEANRVAADLRAPDLALDAFSSGTSAHLRVYEKYWSAHDTEWKEHSGLHQGLMWIHWRRVDIPGRVRRSARTVPRQCWLSSCTKEETTRDTVSPLTNMTLKKVVPPV